MIKYKRKLIGFTSLLVGCYLSLLSVASHAEDWIYTVKMGDTIWDLTRDKLIDRHAWPQMLSKNSINLPRKLLPGTKVNFPLELVKKQSSKVMVAKVSGDVQLLAAGTKQPLSLKLGMVLSSGDSIITGAVGTVLLMLADDSSVLIQAKSKIVLTHVQTLGGAKSQTINFDAELQQGEVEMHANPNHATDSRYLIKTAIANTAVRGTQFYVQSEQDLTRMGVFSGRLDVGNDAGNVSVPGGSGTMAKQGTPPIEPVVLLAAPSNNLPALIESVPYVLSLSSDDELAVKYRVQLSNTDDFIDIIKDEIVDRSFVLDKNLQSGGYYLKSRAVDHHGIEGQALQQTVKIDLLPLAPMMTSTRAVVTRQTINFTWQAVQDADAYRLEVAKDPTFSSLVYEKILKETAAVVNLADEGTYFYRVAAISKNKRQGAMSAAHTLTRRAIPVPSITHHSADARTLNVSWTILNSELVDHYQLQFSDQPDFSRNVIIKNSQTTRWQLVRPTLTDYYVRIVAVDQLGHQGHYSSPIKLTTLPSEQQGKALPLFGTKK